MKLVLQRVKEAKVTVKDEVVGAIGPGLLVFLGLHQGDTREDIPWFVNKVLSLRVFNDDQGKMNLSVKETHGQVLVVSQFTLYANCLKGRRPDYLEAARPEIAEPLYQEFARLVKKELGMVETGVFGAVMEVSLVNDGPVTIILEEKNV